ncbi:MAG: Leucine-rich repeat (LRR) protein [Ulvibacter sp.]|jgi:Leucine-rich repeat (LRR) protein
MKIYFITYLIILISILNGFGQNCFDDFYNKGIEAFNNYKFETALNQFKAAEICDDKPENDDLELWIRKTQDGYLNAIIEAKKDAEQQLKRANKLVESIYFFDNKYALMYGPKKIDNIYFEYDSDGVLKNKMYYFIDKNGDEVYKLGKWDFMENFDKYGFSKGKGIAIDTVYHTDHKTNEDLISVVRFSANEFTLLDTVGNQYRLAYDGDSTEMENITAFYNSYLDSIPQRYFSNANLKVLVSRGSGLKTIPPEIGNLVNLEHVDFRNNQLKDIPKEIFQLKKLKVLYLNGNDLSIDTINKIRTNLPNCELVF